MNKDALIKDLNNNKIVAHPTDTVFGLFARLNKTNIVALNKLKKREEDKPIQIMFSSLKEALQYSTNDYFVMNYLHNNYKDRTSYIVSADVNFAKKILLPSYKRTFMIRIPTGKILDIIKETGPLLATSANISGKDILVDNDEIRKTFNILVSDEKQKSGKASNIISLLNSEIKEIR